MNLTVETIKKHLGHPKEIELEGEELVDGESKQFKTIIKMNPLTPSDIPELYSTLKVAKGLDQDPTSIFQNMDQKFIDTIVKLTLKTMKPNYAEVSDEDLKELIMRNLIYFADALWSQNLNLGSRNIEDVKKQQLMEKLKEKQRLYQEAKAKGV